MAQSETAPPQTSSSWAPAFFTIWTGQAVSLLGSQMVQFALIWWLTKSTGSATVLTTASLVGILPRVILGPFVGALVDRWNRRKIMIFADSGIAAATLLLAYLFSIDRAEIWIIYVILFFRSLGSGFHNPAMTSSTSLMVPDQYLTRIQGLNQTLQNGLNIVSAPLGALLLEFLSVGGVLYIDVASALFAIVPLFFIPIPQPANGSLSQEKRLVRSVWADFRQGLRYVMGWPGLRLILIMAMFINMVVTPAFALLPLLVKDHLGGGALQLGWVNSTFGVGAVVGGLLLSIWGGFQRKIATSQMGLIGLALGMVVIGLAPEGALLVVIIGVALIGLTIPLANGPITAVIQSVVDPEVQGRVFTLVGSLAALMSPLGLIAAGPLSDLISIQIWYLVGAVVNLGFGLGGLASTALMTIEDQTQSKANEQPAREPI
jgi:DHA3 family macrolide efflux protein-like MFS transporter